MKAISHAGGEDLKLSADRLPKLFVFLLMPMLCLWLNGCNEKPSSVSHADKPEMKMHRIQAGELDSTGWCIGQSTEGRFQVRFPATFNDFTISGTDTNGQPLTSFALGTLTPDNTKFSAVLTVKNEFKNGPEKDQIFDGFLRNFERNGNLQHSRRFLFLGQPALEARVGDKSRSAVMRTIVHNSGVYLLIVEFDTDKETNLKGTIATFMDSLSFPTNTSSTH